MDTLDGVERITSKNHHSALKHKDKVEQRILEEIEEGNYVIVNPEDVKIVSPIAAIEKADGDVRLLHDLSFPENKSLNSYAQKESCCYVCGRYS